MPNAADRNPWNRPDCTGIDRLPGRSSGWPYRSAADALADHEPQVLSLDGDWAFRFAESPEQTPADFAEPGTDVTGWDTIAVPGVWTMQGYDRPQYTNVIMPFTPDDPPTIPAANPTGLYRRDVDLPAGWEDQRLVLQLGAATSCATVWWNGTVVGVAKDSRLPSEFDITAVARPGRNVLAVQVVKWSDASYIEDQDQWWHGGLNRGVSLYSTGPAYLRDVGATAGYDVASGSGSLAVTVAAAAIPEPGWSVRGRVYDAIGRCVLGAAPGDFTADLTGDGQTWPRATTAELSGGIAVVEPWSAETPELYTLVVSLHDPVGDEVSAARARIGFRTVEVRDRQLLVNGRAIEVRGVNRHEHHDRRGSAVDRETMRLDVAVLKQFNVNAVRCSHYPPDPYFLDLCDEHGLYVIDEANIEAHAHYDSICADPRYAAAFLDRGSRMVLRDRNHPAIIAWSLGNETGYGVNHDALAGWIRSTDPSRPLHYEGAIARDWAGGKPATDLICPMYPSIDQIVGWAETTDDHRPLIMCEYAHAMGNSCGNLADYWAAIRSHHGLQGGFIWEMLDHGIVKTDDHGQEYWGYGGDFGDEPNDANFVCDGLLWPDRTPHPAMWEAKAVYAPVVAEDASIANHQVLLRNRYDFLDLAHVRVRWSVEIDGTPVESGELAPLSTAPGSAEVRDVPFAEPALTPGQEAVLTLRFVDRRDLPLVGSDHELGCSQVSIGQAPSPAPAWLGGGSDSSKGSGGAGSAGTEDTVRIEQTADGYLLTSDRCRAVVDGSTGLLTEWTVDGTDRACIGAPAGPRLQVWRAPTDNDGIRLWLDHLDDPRFATHRSTLRRWVEQGLDLAEPTTSSVRLDPVHGGVQITTEALLASSTGGGVIHARTMRIDTAGVLDVHDQFTVDDELADLPRLGIGLAVPAEFERLSWYGRGPHESYCDRRTGTPLGRFESTVDGQYVPYVMPQEHGNLTDVRWLALRDVAGAGVLLSTSGDVVEAKASHYSDATLWAARHTTDLVRDDLVHLSVDVRQRGLGGASCGPDTLERYLVGAGIHRLAYRLIPLAAGTDPAVVHRAAGR